MKKKILINIHYLEIGGAETSLIGLLHNINPNDYKIDLLVNDPRGELMKFIPDWVNILNIPDEYKMIERPIIEVIKKGHIKIALSRFWAKYKFSQYCKKNHPKDRSAIFGYIGKYVTPILPSLNLDDYDLAISYLTPHNVVLEKVKAKKKIAWIHTDYSKIDVNISLELPVWDSFDKIVSISPDVTKSFLQTFPSLKEKIIEIENFLPIDLIRKKSMEFVPEKEMPKESDTFNLLTIGRYCEAKRIDEIPYIAKVLKNTGIRFKWYIIGYGNKSEFEKIKDNIEKNNVGEDVIILGKKENPYPYIKACDLYIQPSRYEGKSITVQEAQILSKPVIIRNYPTATSQVKHETDGFIAPYDINFFAKYTADLIQNNKGKIEKVKDNLSKKNFTQQENLQKFNSILHSVK